MGPKVVGDYDADELERQYLPAHWPGVAVQETIARWIQKSTEFHHSVDVVTVAYGDTGRQSIDLLRPERPSAAPVLAFIHGGYWRNTRLTKSSYSFCVEPLVKTGVMVAMIEYDLCPTVSMDTLVGQVRKACAWVWRHAADYGGDSGAFHISGHSAGGHLSAMMAVTNWPSYEAGLPSDMVKSIIPISGLFELEPLRTTSLNNDLRLDASAARRNSPVFMAPASRMPVSIIVGGAESDEFRRQSRSLTDQWMHAGAVNYHETPGHHFSVVEAMTEPHNPVTATILEHLGV
jgi:arylformamidase